jgi:hypothetical protein
LIDDHPAYDEEHPMQSLNLAGATIYPQSVVEQAGVQYFLSAVDAIGTKRLGVIGPADGFIGTRTTQGVLCPCSPENAAALRARLPWLNPVPLGRHISFGFGDRLGSATAGHILALRECGGEATIAPIYAQQSVRENSRTGHTPQQVLDAAMWGVFQMGWRAPWGADADHVKEVGDLGPFVAAGYTMYTIDPSDYVDNAAQTDPLEVLRVKVADLPWDVLKTTYEKLYQDYCRAPVVLDGLTIEFSEIQLLRALAKYGRAIAHTATIAAALQAQVGHARYEIEVSVDETDTPTSVQEHFFIAAELRGRAIPVVSLAPRFVGKFQKGVDYIGDRDLFSAELARHAAIMNHFDSYKLSIHTGSDKFSIYPIIAQQTQDRVHVKTAGTSYLEALRLVAAGDPALFREIVAYACAHFAHDRKTYYLDAQIENVPAPDGIAPAQLPALLDQFDTRQVLHVTFGSILDRYGAAIRTFIGAHETEYAARLVQHFDRHLRPFLPAATAV